VIVSSKNLCLKSNAQVAVIRPRFLSSQHQANQFTVGHVSQNKQITGMIVMVAVTMKGLARNRSGQDEETTGSKQRGRDYQRLSKTVDSDS